MPHAWPHTALVLGALAWPWSSLRGQTQYFNLDAGRPTRVEDAIPAERNALEVLLAPLRVERLSGGMERWRVEPKALYGILPFTELEVRLPVIRAFAPHHSTSSTGTAGVGVGLLHAFNLETAGLPAVALATEVLLPAGQFSGAAASYTVKALVTRTTALARLHFNGAVGTYSVRSLAGADTTCTLFTPTGVCANGNLVPVLIDLPCGSAPPATSQKSVSSLAAASASLVPARTHGPHWLVGIGADHALPLQSLLLTGDIYAERFVGLYSSTDWTAEVGARHQWTPRLVFDLGAARHFAGLIQSTAATLGLSYTFSIRGL